MKRLLTAFAVSATLRISSAGAAEPVSPALAPLDALYPDLEKLYLDLHQTPELSFREEKTAAKMAERLRTLGFLVEEHVVTADDPLYIVGQARTELGELVIGKPSMQPFIVSRTPAVRVNAAQD